MAIVPQPNTPNVSKSQAGPSISGDAMAAPGRALAQVGNAISQTGADIRARKIKAEKDLYKKQQDIIAQNIKAEKEQQDIIAQKIKVENEIYKKQQDIRQHELNLSAKAVSETMNDAYANAQPSEFQEIFDTVWAQHSDRFQSVVEDMKPEDRQVYEAKFELDQAALQAHTNLLKTRKIIDNQTATAMDMFKLNIGDNTPEALEKVKKAEEILAENLGPEKAAVKLSEIKSGAYYDQLRQGYLNAVTLDDIAALNAEFEDTKPNIQSGHQTAIKNESISALNRINAQNDRLYKDFVRIGESGEPLPVDEIENKVDNGLLSRKQADELYELASSKRNSIEEESALGVYKRVKHRAVEIRLQEEIFNQLVANNPAFTLELLRKAEKIIDDSTSISAARVYAKQQLHAKFRHATEVSDRTWWGKRKAWMNNQFGTKFGVSENMGDSFNDLPEAMQDKARTQYGTMLDRVGIVMDQTQSDFNLSELYTDLENRLVELYSTSDQPITEKQVQDLTDYAMGYTAGKIVKAAIQKQASSLNDQEREEAIQWLKENPNHPDADAARQALGTVDLF